MSTPARADLHAHTRASDGDLAPAELVHRAAGLGIGTLAVTDHDTLAGLDEALAAGAATGVRVIPGIEISVAVERGMFHLLGYLPGPAPEPLAGRLQELRGHRARRMERILARLAELGAPVTMADVARHTDGTVGRPHVAAALVDAGHAASRADAFARFLADDAPAYVPHRGVGPHEAVRLVRASGGAPVLAHPATLRLGTRHLHGTVQSLRDAGLVGIEVHRPEHTPEQRDAYALIARRLRLVPCGGSDFHAPGQRFELGDTGVPPLPPDTPDGLFRALDQGVPSPG
ncbi:MAG: PHP domain-containing protein [Thermoleophilia bacterium]|nr:PHP domain-containing protein [Thermoleophilia bacterium]